MCTSTHPAKFSHIWSHTYHVFVSSQAVPSAGTEGTDPISSLLSPFSESLVVHGAFARRAGGGTVLGIRWWLFRLSDLGEWWRFRNGSRNGGLRGLHVPAHGGRRVGGGWECSSGKNGDGVSAAASSPQHVSKQKEAADQISYQKHLQHQKISTPLM